MISGKVAQPVRLLDGGGIAVNSKMNINIGSGRAYNFANKAGGALLHMCVGARVHLPNGIVYEGSESNATCVGKFMKDFAQIRAAGWKDPKVGALAWYGVHATGEATIAGKRVDGVVPTQQPGVSGFLVSPTALGNPAFSASDQRRYVEPLTVPTAVIPRIKRLPDGAGVELGSAGVAFSRRTGESVAFIVGDIGPRIGEGSPALARSLERLAIDSNVTHANRYAGQVDTPDIVWVFFGGPVIPPPYDADHVIPAVSAAFAAWGGNTRLKACVDDTSLPGRK